MTAKSAPGVVEIVRHYFSRNPKRSKQHGGVCVYARHQRGDSFITVSTAVCSTGDQYSKKYGKNLAMSSPSIKLPIGDHYNKNNFSRDELLKHVEYYFESSLGDRYLDHKPKMMPLNIDITDERGW